MTVEFHPEAERELLAARSWYEERSLDAARAFGTEIAWAVGQIALSPTRWKRYEHGTRHYFLPNFPFSIVYREHGGDVQVLAVAHHRRRPGYWRDR